MAANEIVANVQNRITELEQGSNGLKLPSDYSLGNALNAAWLMITDDSKLMATSDNSKAQTLLNMAIQGLSPAKQQGYFIPYGNKLTFQRSYFGGLTILQRLDNVKGKPFAEVVHQDDEFEIGSDDFGRTIVSKFEPKFENQDKPIIGAFALVTTKSDEQVYTIMTKKMIDQSWSHTKMKTNKVQSEFPEEMAKRTVLNRAAKMFINTSGDNDMLIKAVNETTADEFDNERVVVNETPKDSVAGLFENEFKDRKPVDVIEEGETNASDGEEPEIVEPGNEQR
jgi:recombination protein RecT